MRCKSQQARLILLRTSPEQYLQLAKQAEGAGKSLNSLVLSMLGFNVPFNQAGRRGRRPGKSNATSRVMLRLSPEQHAQLADIARRSSCSLNTLILEMLDLDTPFRQRSKPSGPKPR